MAANEERDHVQKLAWPPEDDGGLDVFDLDLNRPAAQRAGERSTDSRRDEVAESTTVATRPVRRQPEGGRAARAQRDEPPHIGAAASRPRRWKWPAVSLAIPRLRRPRRPAWLTAERAGIIALALLTIGEASFIGARLIRSNTASPASSRNTTTRGVSSAKHPSLQNQTSAGVVGTSGRLLIATSPSGGGVAVDGRELGTAPVSLDNVSEGEHTVVVQSRHGSLSQQVHIAAGRETQVVVPLAAAVESTPRATAPRPAAAAEGWLSVDAPIEMRIFEGDRMIGTSEMPQIPLPPGRHALVFANDDIGYRHAQNVVVTARKGSAVALDLPKQTVAVNALPWADVWIDGVHVGETPIGRATVAVGRHTVLLRNPDFGERTVNTTVTAKEPARISVNMRK